MKAAALDGEQPQVKSSQVGGGGLAWTLDGCEHHAGLGDVERVDASAKERGGESGCGGSERASKQRGGGWREKAGGTRGRGGGGVAGSAHTQEAAPATAPGKSLSRSAGAPEAPSRGTQAMQASNATILIPISGTDLRAFAELPRKRALTPPCANMTRQEPSTPADATAHSEPACMSVVTRSCALETMHTLRGLLWRIFGSHESGTSGATMVRETTPAKAPEANVDARDSSPTPGALWRFMPTRAGRGHQSKGLRPVANLRPHLQSTDGGSASVQLPSSAGIRGEKGDCGPLGP
jgi:hypothetical protein